MATRRETQFRSRKLDNSFRYGGRRYYLPAEFPVFQLNHWADTLLRKGQMYEVDAVEWIRGKMAQNWDKSQRDDEKFTLLAVRYTLSRWKQIERDAIKQERGSK